MSPCAGSTGPPRARSPAGLDPFRQVQQRVSRSAGSRFKAGPGDAGQLMKRFVVRGQIGLVEFGE